MKMEKISKSRNEEFGLKLFVSVILISICLILMIFPANAKIHISSTYYNSDTIVTEDITTINAQYLGATALMPNFIVSGGAGKSEEDAIFSEFSHRISMTHSGKNYETESNLKSDSGEYNWGKGVSTRHNEVSMGMTVGYKLEDGSITALYRNSDSTASEKLMAEGLQYTGSAVVVPNAIIAAGAGKSEQDVASSDFSHETYVESNGKWAKIETNLESTSVGYQLNNKANVLPQEVLVSVLEKGGTKDGTVATEIYGTASNFPLQHLPPGQFDYNAVPVVYMYTENLGWNIYDLNNPPESAPPESAPSETFAPLIADGDFTFDLSMGFTWKSANGFG